jgi:hypothetical protein
MAIQAMQIGNGRKVGIDFKTSIPCKHNEPNLEKYILYQ